MSKHTKRKVKRSSQNITLWIARWAMRILPRKFVQTIIIFLFSIAYNFTKRLRKICARNLRYVYKEEKSDEDYERMIKACIKNVGFNMLDLLYFVNRPEKLNENTSIHGEEHLKKALGQDKGVIAVSAHLSNFPLLFVSLVQKGYKVNVIIRPMRDGGFSRFMHDLCDIWDINMIKTLPRKNFLRESRNALRRNELLFILSDEPVAVDEGMMVEFFNMQVPRGIGPLLFHKRYHAPVVPIFIAQDEEQKFHIYIEPEFKLEERLSEGENDLNNMSGLTKIIEKYILKFPLQWGGWLSKKWNY